MMATLAELVKAEVAADAERRAWGAVPDVFRPPGAVHEAWSRWEAAHRDLAEARAAQLEAAA